MSVNPIIEAKDISFSYNSTVVLDKVSFSIEKGDYVGIIGPNGGGKTTMLKILVGLIKPDSGSLTILVPQRIAQDAISFPATVYEVVESGLIAKKGLYGNNTTAEKNAIEKALQRAHIADLKHRLMSSLSGGQRQRVYVTRALASDPQILILDEPFTGVDTVSQRDFYTFLKDLNSREHITILFVSHDIDTITKEIKSVLCLNRGLFCFGNKDIMHEENTIEKIYGKEITHIHHAR